MLPDGRALQRRELLMEALQLNIEAFQADRRSSALCVAVGRSLNGDETFAVGGRKWSARELLFRAIDMDPSNAAAYVGLSDLLGPDDTIVMEDGRCLNKHTLLGEAILRDVRCSEAYVRVGNGMVPQSYPLPVPNGTGGKRVMSRRELYLEAIICDPHNSAAFLLLSRTLRDGEQIAVPGGSSSMDRTDLLREAIRLDSNNGGAYIALAEDTLSRGLQSVTLPPDGCVWTVEELFQEAHRIENA